MAARYLSQEWLDETRAMAADHPVDAGLSAQIQYVITAGPDGDVKYTSTVADGVLADAQLGSVREPDITITAPYATWVEITRGDLDLAAGFMQGAVKVAGDTGRFLRLLSVTQSRDALELRAKIHAATEYA